MITERSLLAPIRRLFSPDRYLIKTEVPFGGKSIDVLLLDKRTRRLLAIELKVKKWRKALRQAAVYQLGAHGVFVALWHSHIRPLNVSLISHFGLGVIAIGPGRGRGLKASIVAKAMKKGILNRGHAMELRAHFS